MQVNVGEEGRVLRVGVWVLCAPTLACSRCVAMVTLLTYVRSMYVCNSTYCLAWLGIQPDDDGDALRCSLARSHSSRSGPTHERWGLCSLPACLLACVRSPS